MDVIVIRYSTHEDVLCSRTRNVGIRSVVLLPVLVCGTPVIYAEHAGHHPVGYTHLFPGCGINGYVTTQKKQTNSEMITHYNQKVLPEYSLYRIRWLKQYRRYGS